MIQENISRRPPPASNGSSYACIACKRPFSEDQVEAVVQARLLRSDPISLEYPAENARLYPVCEDHGLRHLETPETRAVFKTSYFDPEVADAP